jgi:predicted branched-subunit amino acid permease
MAPPHCGVLPDGRGVRRVATRPAPTFGFLLGAELSLFATWNLATLGGAFLGAAIPDPTELGLDLVFPLAFLALLVPLVRTRAELVVAVASGVVAYLVAQVSSGGIPIVVTGVGGSVLGAWLTRGREVDERRLEDAIREVA